MRVQGSGIKCTETMTLIKEDNSEPGQCVKCNQERYCKIYECKECQSTFCYYCLVDEQKKNLLSLADAKALIEDTPFLIKSQCTEQEAKEIQNKFRKAGAHAFYASSDVWDNIIASKTTSKASDIAPPLPNVSNVPTFGADENSVQDESYSTVTAESASEEKGNNCGAGCVSLFFYCLGALMTLAGCSDYEGGWVLFGLVFIGIGYGVQKASGTK